MGDIENYDGRVAATTKTRAKAGTTEFLAITCNEDDDGYPLECERDSFTTRETAQQWAETSLTRQTDASFVYIHETAYEATEYHDPTYGHVRDAYAVDKTTQYGELVDGQVTWDEPEPG